MDEQRLKTLSPTTGAVTWNTRFSKKAFLPITGNVTLSLDGMTYNGKGVELFVKQDATGGRTLTITAAPGGANVTIGSATGLNATANATTKVIINIVNGVFNIVWAGGA